jgi:hypothetical protein
MSLSFPLSLSLAALSGLRFEEPPDGDAEEEPVSRSLGEMHE